MQTEADMMAIPINFAEAIIEPFFNGGTSDQNEVRNTFVIDHYEKTWHSGAIGKVVQMWDGVYAFVQGGAAGERCLTLERSCRLDVSGYDTFVAFVGLPKWVRMSVTITVDGTDYTVIDRAAGDEKAIEVQGHYAGAVLSRISAVFSLEEAPEETTFHLKWFGLAHAADRDRMLARTSRYTPDWPGFLEPETTTGAPIPSIGIYFDADELSRIRELVGSEPFATVFEGIRRQAEKDLEIVPEKYIGETNPGGTDRYIRVGRREMPDMCGPAVRLGFVGLVEANDQMSRLSARMALSLAFCQTWDESTIGHLPGSIWHHRSFSQERAIKAVSLALDWAGHHLTAEAKRVIRDAIIMKGLPRLENDFRTIEYIRRMNQGIVFNAARIIGLLALLPVYPRYRERLEEAERDLHEMIGNYVHADGGTLEGCGYWNYTFSNAIPQCYLLARYHRKSLAEYATEEIRSTGEYPLAMLSVAGDGTTCLPVNDGHSNPVSPLLAAAFSQLSDNPDWKAYYARCLTPERVQPVFEHLVLHPEGFDGRAYADSPLAKPRFRELSETGQIDSVRRDEAGRLVHLHALSGPVEPGHYHDDKGSFILEVDDDALLIDRGICNYGHPMTVSMKKPRLHNTLTPDNPAGLPIEQPNDVPGGKITASGEHDEAVWLASDNTLAWEPGIFDRSVRRIVSPDPSLILIDDEIALTSPRSMTFNLHTRKRVTIEDNTISVSGELSSIRISPLNWKPESVVARIDGIDEHLDEVTAIRAVAAKSRAHRLVTAIEILSPDSAAPSKAAPATTAPAKTDSGSALDQTHGANASPWEMRMENGLLTGGQAGRVFTLDVSQSGGALFAVEVDGARVLEERL